MGIIQQEPVQLVTISGRVVPCTSITTSHNVDQGIGTCSLTMPAMFGGVGLGADVRVQLGYRSAGTRPVFSGTIQEVERHFGADGWELKATCDGPLQRMVDGDEVSYSYPEIYLGDLIRSLAKKRGVTPMVVDRIKSPVDFALDKNWIMLGGNRYVDGGQVVIPRRTGLYGYLSGLCKLFGYRLFDLPRGGSRAARISGIPPAAYQHLATEGVDIFRIDRSERLKEMVTYWTVDGASYTDDNGVPIKWRSRPVSVPRDDRLRPKGYRAGDVSDGILTNQFLVDAVRQAMETDHAAPSETVSWELAGAPDIQPGDVMRVNSPTVGVARNLWVMGVRHAFNESGFWTTVDAWSGAGKILPTGNDAKTIAVLDDAVHIGDESIGWYAMPGPRGRDISVNISVPDDYTALVLEWWSHGCNSYFLDGASSESSVSKIVVAQGGEEVGSVEMPMQPEEYEKRRPYGRGVNEANGWRFNRIPVPGSLSRGTATVRFVSGEDKRLPEATKWDDFEVAQVRLVMTGAFEPVLPTPRG